MPTCVSNETVDTPCYSREVTWKRQIHHVSARLHLKLTHPQGCIINRKLVKNQDCSPADSQQAEWLKYYFYVVCVGSEQPDIDRLRNRYSTFLTNGCGAAIIAYSSILWWWNGTARIRAHAFDCSPHHEFAHKARVVKEMLYYSSFYR